MSLGKLNVFVMRPDSCGVDDRTWLVSVFRCDGHPLVWCDRKYVGLPARCGHLDVDLPPGCYSIVASWRPEFWPPRPMPPLVPPDPIPGPNPGPIPPLPPRLPGLVYSDHAAVTVSCGETACVQLFTPSARRRARLLEAELSMLEGLPEPERPPADVVDRVRRALADLAGNLPATTHSLELADLERQ